MLIDRLRKRSTCGTSEGGFTLIELLVVIIIIGILLVISIPSYLRFLDRVNDQTARDDIHAAVPGVKEYFADNGTYLGITLTGLKSSYDQDIKSVSFPTLAADGYCIQNVASDAGGKQWHLTGPGGDIARGSCP